MEIKWEKYRNVNVCISSVIDREYENFNAIHVSPKSDYYIRIYT